MLIYKPKHLKCVIYIDLAD